VDSTPKIHSRHVAANPPGTYFAPRRWGENASGRGYVGSVAVGVGSMNAGRGGVRGRVGGGGWNVKRGAVWDGG